MRDKPWAMRTYAGHSSAAGSNALYRRNLAQGQTGLSVAFDLPTQTGYDPDDLREAGLSDVPVIVGGIIPGSDARALEAQGVAAVFTPKDFGLTQIMDRIVDVIRSANGLD